MGKVFVGHDWAEAHHDVSCRRRAGPPARAAAGCLRASRGWPGSMSWSRRLVDDPGRGGDRDRDRSGPVRRGVGRGGLQVLAVNPMSTSRYRERHSTSGAKSDPGDA